MKLLIICLLTAAPSVWACGLSEELKYSVRPDGSAIAKAELLSTWDGSAVTPLLTLEKFRDDARLKTDVDPVRLLERQAKLFARIPHILPTFQKVLGGKLGRIAEIACLEAQILDSHLAQKSATSEFAAYVLTKDDRAKVYVLTWNEPFVNSSPEIDAQIDADIAGGWTLRVHLHNHPFFFDNPAGDIAGTTVPSDGDLSFYPRVIAKWALREARITNGFNTIRLDASEL